MVAAVDGLQPSETGATLLPGIATIAHKITAGVKGVRKRPEVRRGEQKYGPARPPGRMVRVGIEPTTPAFSGLCSTS